MNIKEKFGCDAQCYNGSQDAEPFQALESLPLGSHKDYAISFCGNPYAIERPLPNTSCYYYSSYGSAFGRDKFYELVFINDTLAGILLGKQKLK